MPILQQHDRQAVQERFDVGLKRDVNIALFTQANIGGLFIPGRECRSCKPAQQLLEEVSALSPKIHLEVVDYYSDQEASAARGISRIPGIIIGSNKRDNVKYYGLPSGFEFALLLDTIVAASTGRTDLALESRRRLKRLQEDVHIQVFVTPNCQYCPMVARLAHSMAMESPRVCADVVEVQEFPDVAQAYRVMGVPRTIINDRIDFTGAVTEEVFLQRVLEAVGEADAGDDEAERGSNQITPVG